MSDVETAKLPMNYDYISMLTLSVKQCIIHSVAKAVG